MKGIKLNQPLMKKLLLLLSIGFIFGCGEPAKTVNSAPTSSTPKLNPELELFSLIKKNYTDSNYLGVELKYANLHFDFPDSPYLDSLKNIYNESVSINNALELEQEGDGIITTVPLLTKADLEKPKRDNADAEPYMQYFSSSRSDFSRLVKSNLNDPDSFKFVETKYRDNGDGTITLIMEFRAKNALGGVITSKATAEFSKASKEFRNLAIN